MTRNNNHPKRKRHEAELMALMMGVGVLKTNHWICAFEIAASDK